METLIAFADNAEHAVHLLAPMHLPHRPTRWVLVACPPRLTRHSSRWISQRARDDWRQRWAQALLQAVQPVLATPGHEITLRVAEQATEAQVAELRREFGAARLVDVRRPKFGEELPAIDGVTRPQDGGVRWQLPGAVAGMSAMLILAAE